MTPYSLENKIQWIYFFFGDEERKKEGFSVSWGSSNRFGLEIKALAPPRTSSCTAFLL